MIRYFLLANLYAFLFYGLYLLLLRNRTSHSWSRCYLLAAVLLSLVLPFIRPEWVTAGQTDGIAALSAFTLPEVVLQPAADISFNAQNLPYYLLILYITGVYGFLAAFIYRLIRLQLFLRQHCFERCEGYRIAINTGVGPASFGASIVFPGEKTDGVILEHEKAHLRFGHHYDKLLLQTISCFFYPIVALHFIRKELELVHEFQADATAASDRQSYTYMLLAEHLGTQQLSLLQSFFHHPIKRRIMMLQSKKQGKGLIAKSFLLLSSALICATIVLAQGKSSKTRVSAKDQKNPVIQQKVYSLVDKVPEYPGGQSMLMTFLSENIKYPESAKKAAIAGRIVSQFIIGSDGKVRDIKILRGLHPDCDQEVLRVLQSMPAWTPGEKDGKKVSVYYTLPVSFKLEEEKAGQK